AAHFERLDLSGEPRLCHHVAFAIEQIGAASLRRRDLERIAQQPLCAIVARAETEGVRLQVHRRVVPQACAVDYRETHEGKAASIHSDGRSCTLRRMRSCHQSEMARRSSRW